MKKAFNILALALLSLTMLQCAPKGAHTVCFFGSSVCKGVGADNEQGYAYMVGQNLPKGWDYTNLSVSGNCTYDLFARFDADLTPSPARYVVLGLSLGNEGLHEKGRRAMLSYSENMPRLIQMMHDQGRTVIVTNNYSRADFNEVDFRDLCRMNLEVQQWDVPTVNLFGNIDDGAGHWAEGFWNGEDIWHPNTEGHRQMASAFVPSLWEAIDAGKPLPVRTDTAIHATGVSKLEFDAEPGLCSFTLSYISADTCYALVYSALRQATLLYANGVLLSPEEASRVHVSTDAQQHFTLSGTDLRQLFFFRAAMTPLEVQALVDGLMLRSSLELYCPLTEGRTENLAQSMNQSLHVAK